MKKYVAEWKEVRIVLTEDDYKILLERFDINNFVEERCNGNIHLVNDTPCPLCEKYFSCQGCPFDLYPRDNGCIKVIVEAMEEANISPFATIHIYRTGINLARDIEKGKQTVTLIRELLLTKFKVMEE